MSARLNSILPRPRADAEEYSRMTDYEKGLLHGGIELWDKLDQLVRGGQLVIADSPAFVKAFDQLSYRQQQLALTGILPEPKL